jgi:hypothetical protein
VGQFPKSCVLQNTSWWTMSKMPAISQLKSVDMFYLFLLWTFLPSALPVSQTVMFMLKHVQTGIEMFMPYARSQLLPLSCSLVIHHLPISIPCYPFPFILLIFALPTPLLFEIIVINTRYHYQCSSVLVIAFHRRLSDLSIPSWISKSFFF